MKGNTALAIVAPVNVKENTKRSISVRAGFVGATASMTTLSHAATNATGEICQGKVQDSINLRKSETNVELCETLNSGRSVRSRLHKY